MDENVVDHILVNRRSLGAVINDRRIWQLNQLTLKGKQLMNLGYLQNLAWIIDEL
jgi:hypothetical protein